MDFLKAEIERKKKEKERLAAELAKKQETNSDNNVTDGNTKENGDSNGTAKKKWVKRGDLEKIREQQYLEEMEKEKEKREAKKPKTDHVKDNNEGDSKHDESTILALPLEEIYRRLRERGEPITYFGETDIQRAQRLHKLEEREPLEYIHGGHDDFGRTLRQLEEENEEESKKQKKEKKKREQKPEDLIDPFDTQREEPLLQTKEAFVLSLFRRLLKIWGQELDERSELHKRSSQGRIDTVTYMQTRKHIKTFFRLLKKRALAEDLLNHIHNIAMQLREREYVKAHDAYLRMAIGNAPWPMGVTMVGIHERSAREKIHSNQVAHVLNDETQRKYIQAIKRLMTFCQRKYPTDPSKTVG